MQVNSSNSERGVLTLSKGLRALLLALFLILTSFANGRAADIVASNKQPLSFGKDQTLIDLNKVVWPPEVEKR